MNQCTIKTLATAGLVMLKDNKLLLAFSSKKQAWYLPGGKIDPGEDAVQALIREIKEELNLVLNPLLITYYTHNTAPAFGEQNNVLMEQECYFYPSVNNIKPSAEITAVKYFSLKDYYKEKAQVPGVILIFHKLYAGNLLTEEHPVSKK